jgi:hypothetical protein
MSSETTRDFLRRRQTAARRFMAAGAVATESPLSSTNACIVDAHGSLRSPDDDRAEPDEGTQR